MTFQLIASDEAVWPCYRLARRDEVEENMEEVQIAITDEWAIVELEDGEISGSGYEWAIGEEKRDGYGHKLLTFKTTEELEWRVGEPGETEDGSAPEGVRLGMFFEAQTCKDAIDAVAADFPWVFFELEDGEMAGHGYCLDEQLSQDKKNAYGYKLYCW